MRVVYCNPDVNRLYSVPYLLGWNWRGSRPRKGPAKAGGGPQDGQTFFSIDSFY